MFDAIVIGLGGMGSAACYHLSARGKRVLGLDRYGPAHDRGSSHGDSRIIRQAYHENPAYVPLVLRAYELWQQLQHDSGAEILQITGGLMLGPPGSAVVQGTILSATEHRLPFEVLSSAEIVRRFPPFRPRADETAVYENRAGFLRPEAGVKAHLKLAAQHGADLHFDEPVTRWTANASGDGVEVVTAQGSYQAARLVLSPGAWAPEILGDLQLPFEVRRHVMCWFEPSTGFDSFLPYRFPIYIWDVNGVDCFYGFPAADGPHGGVKAAMHSGGEKCLPADLYRETEHTAEVAEMRRYLSEFIPALNGPLLRAIPCMYTLTPDEHFIISVHPSHPQVSLAAGFSGHGFKFTCVVGEILADLAIEGTTRHPIALFSPARFRPQPEERASTLRTTT